MRWKLFKSPQTVAESESIEKELSIEGIPTSSNVSDEPPAFLQQSWLEFNDRFNDDELLVYGRPNKDDCLGRAAVIGVKTRAAIKEKYFDIAWWLLHQQKALYLEHASKFNFDDKSIIGLDSGISREMANILRLEGKHKQALVHVLYWQLGESREQVNRDLKKLRAYYNRSKVDSITFDQMIDWMDNYQGLANYSTIQATVEKWKTSR